MTTTTIFLSHHPRTQEARKYLDAVRDALVAEKDVELQVDEKPLADDSWRAHIYAWMAEAHAAVLFLDRNDLAVRKPPLQAIASYCRCQKHSFLLLPVLIDEADTNATGLDRLVAAESPEDAAEKVVDRLQRLCRRCPPQWPWRPHEILVDQGANVLTKAHFDESDLARAVDAVDECPEMPLDDQSDCHRRLVALLMRTDFNLACEVLLKLAETRPRARYAVRELLDLITPCWVREEEARPIAEVALADRRCRQLALDVEHMDSVHSFICRSLVQPQKVSSLVFELEPPTTEDSHASLKEQILENVRSRQPRRRSEKNEHVLLAKLVSREQEGKPVFVVFPRDWTPDAELLDEMRREFPSPVVIAMASGEKLATPEHPFCELPRPQPQERENMAWAAYSNTRDDLDNLDEGRGENDE